jgi:hypothetical protein
VIWLSEFNTVNTALVEYILLGVTPASELSESTFRNLVSGPSSWSSAQESGSETSTHLIQKPGLHPKEYTVHQQLGESLKTKILLLISPHDFPLNIHNSIFRFRQYI